MNLSAKQEPCSELAKKAEQEFGAFVVAVTQLFGSEEARVSAEDWLRELETARLNPASSREWRRITVNASARLANRVNANKRVRVA